VFSSATFSTFFLLVPRAFSCPRRFMYKYYKVMVLIPQKRAILLPWKVKRYSDSKKNIEKLSWIFQAWRKFCKFYPKGRELCKSVVETQSSHCFHFWPSVFVILFESFIEILWFISYNKRMEAFAERNWIERQTQTNEFRSKVIRLINSIQKVKEVV
jgi:hypothetical protein